MKMRHAPQASLRDAARLAFTHRALKRTATLKRRYATNALLRDECVAVT